MRRPEVGRQSRREAALDGTEGCAIYYGGGTAPTVGAATPGSPGEMACTQ